ncbi:MAG TPA: hypothetical protein VHX37_06535 [Acidobacteriaceae bacterium]|nr:hypothetical protein [Acidobacteriaceae bacterium]
MPILSRLPASLFEEDCSSVARIIAQKRDASTAIFAWKLRVLCGNGGRIFCAAQISETDFALQRPVAPPEQRARAFCMVYGDGARKSKKEAE